MKLVDTFWFNAAWFQATWFCCVLGREPWVPVALLSLVLHFYLVSDRGLEFRRLLPIAMVGIGVDVVLTLTGVFDFDSATIVPLWLILLWWVFAAALYRSFAKIGQSMWLAAVLGGIAVPFNYMVGAGLGAVSLPLGEMLSIAILVAIWVFLLPLLYRISHRMVPAA
jgi:hypothetical protein